jgi:small subunit ribosomal protein S3Ae
MVEKPKKAPALAAKKKKSWYSIHAPDLFGRAVIGETLVEESAALLGKHIELRLMTLTGDMKKQNTTIAFVVDQIAENKGATRVVGYHVLPGSMKRMMRRGRTRVDASFVCVCKDGMKVRLKPFILTVFATNRSTATRLRNVVSAFLATYVAAHDFNTLVKDIVSGKLQMYVTFVARKVYPVFTAGIRALEVQKETVKVTIAPQQNLDVAALMNAAEVAPRTRPRTFSRPAAEQQSSEAAQG